MACAAVLAALVGCGGGGGSDDTSSAENAARAYVEASNDRDFDRLCNVLSESYKLQLHMGSRCVGFLQEQTSGAKRLSLKVADVQVNGDQAVAHVTGTIETETGTGQSRLQLQLQDVDGGWHVTHQGGNVDY
jgi:ketosteroid isomerase-like protein